MASSGPRANVSAEKTTAVDANDPATCEACHGQVVAEWRESQHARASHESDPVYAALRTLRTRKQGEGIPAQCATCHNPRDPVDHGSAAARTGVSCGTCHQIDEVRLDGGKKGHGALTATTDLRFRGPHDIAEGASPVHATGPALAPVVDGKTVCLACHGEEKNASGVVTCATGTEHGATDASSCATCHMDEVAGPSGSAATRSTHRSHRFRGPQLALRSGEPGILAEAVELSGVFEGRRFVAAVSNRSGHAFPTGFPGRMAILELRGIDGGGREIYRNVSNEPMKQHPDAVFNMGFVDGEGQPALAAFASKLVRDNRIRPSETRTIEVEAPLEIAKMELSLKLVLVPGPLAKAIGYEGPATKPIVTAPIVVTR